MCVQVTSRPEQNTKAAGILQRLSGDQGHKTDPTVHGGSARVGLQVTHAKCFFFFPRVIITLKILLGPGASEQSKLG